MHIIKQNLSFVVSKYLDSYYIKNKTQVNIEVRIENIQDMDVVSKFTLKPAEEKEWTPIYDGHFGVFFNENDDPFVVLDCYDLTIKNIIQRTEDILCGCNQCESCTEVTDCEKSLNLLYLMNVYMVVRKTYFYNTSDIVFQNLKETLNSDLFCFINQSTFYGKKENSLYIKRLVAYFYLTFYFKEILKAIDKKEAVYIREKFSYAYIKKCIEKLGINPDNMVETLTSGMVVSYWQYPDPTYNISSVDLNWSPNYLNSLGGVLDRPLEDFEEGVVVPYNKIGRIGFAIAPSPLMNFTIYDSLGNNITHNFEVRYFDEDKTAVYVSILPYSISEIFFKFKKNIYA